jgi:hypothetical protein
MNQAVIFEGSFERNQGLIVKETEGLTHAESVLQLPFESNCMNWVLGHLAVYRDALLGCTRQMPRLSVAERKLYIQGAPPITPESEAVPLERLLAAVAEGFEALGVWLQNNPEGLLEETPPGLELSFGATVAENFALLCWHDSYHVGQLAVLRELALSCRGE